MKNKLMMLFVFTTSIFSAFTQSGDFDCVEDTAFQTKFIVGSSYYIQNIPRGIKFLTRFAESGCLDAQLKLSEIYSNSEDKYGVFDTQKACYFAKKAADAGSEKARKLLLELYKKENGCDLEDDEIVAYMTCDEKTDKVYTLLKGNTIVVADEIKAIERLTKFADEGCVEAQYIVGKYAKKGFRDKIEIDYNKAYQYLTMAVNQGHPRAHAHLGQLYERGYGCDLNYNKALELFENGYHLGDDMSAYCIGYDYLRGMGNVEQNYDKAITWFEKSNYQMAKHWLAILNYFGFGMPINKDQAIELLVNNEGIYNSPRLLEHLELHKNDPETILGDFKEFDIDQETEQVNEVLTTEYEDFNVEISIDNITSNWQGKLVELDFASEYIVREFPIAVNLEKNSNADAVNYTTTINNNSYSGEGILQDESLYFDDFTISIPKLYKDNLVDSLSLKVLSADLELKKLNHIEYLTAFVESKELNWNEKGTPLLLVLTNTEVVTDNGEVISQEIINELLNTQSNNFIKLFPNPFQSDLLIQYDLAIEGYTTVEIYSLHGGFYKKVVDNHLQPAGEKLYFFDGDNLENGYYVVKVTVNGLVHTKVIIKE
ncbi:T9SS type A sorting domain-containing protein [Flavivirga aquimarina]|uniref:T9SS type A sorting domain-containing protein n=1 Tax=Flavivirga aquimarina TaxID=2027862 RepID=A0ABT8W808_9FLAO|nr:T9SS type A sorting domain-containing protein [Flavivirga aquimarina]MDO5969243.1 T9SS type A sorting domain-containing protein [Flavivirga aquimarina]